MTNKDKKIENKYFKLQFKYSESDELSILSYMNNLIKYNSKFIQKIKPDGALGDRYEMYNAITCFNLKIPIIVYVVADSWIF